MPCSWELEDPEFKELIDILDQFNDDLGNGVMADFIPVFKCIPTPGVRLLKKGIKVIFGMITHFWKDHKEKFDAGRQNKDH